MEIGRARLVLDLGLDREQLEHLLEVGQRLLDVAVDHAEEIQRHVELDEIGVHHHEIADRHRMVGDAAPGEQHDADEAAGDDRALADIEQRQRRLALHRGPLVGAQRFVEALRLVLLVGEVLHRLEIEQAVDRLGVGLGVALVHLAAMLDAPVGDDEGESDVAEDRDERDDGEFEGVEVPQDAADEQDLEQRRNDVEQHEREQELDAADAALDRPRHAAGLALEMEAQRQAVEMAEGVEPDHAHGMLLDLGEDRIAQLARGLRHDPCDAVGDDQHHRHGDDLLRGAERVDGLPVEQRHADIDEFRDDEARHRQDDTGPELDRFARPDIGKELAEAAQLLAEAGLGLGVGQRRRCRMARAHGRCAFVAKARPTRRERRRARMTTSAMITAPAT